MDYNFNLDSNKRDNVTLDDFKGKYLVLYFYPKNYTKGCTIEAEGFRDLYDEFKKLGAEVVGVSRDGKRSHKNFSKKYDLPFEILSDKDRKLAERYGLLSPGKMYGKDVIKSERATFVFDEDSNMIKEFRNVKPENHPEEVLEFIASLDE